MTVEKMEAVPGLDPAQLLQIFGERPGRMVLLEKTLDFLKLGKESHILETGCSFGDGLSYALDKTGGCGRGLDLVEDYVRMAIEKHPELSFDCGSVYEMPYRQEEFNLVFSQAAFSLLKEKDRAIDEFHRILVPGGHVAINDFVSRESVDSELRDQMNFIPCFNSIATIPEYQSFFEKRGFETVLAKERYSEIITTTLHLSKMYKCTPSEMTALFARILGSGNNAEDNCRCFFNKTRVSYAQLIFRKL